MPTRVSVAMHNGRPMLHIDGMPRVLPMYSPVSARRPELFKRQVQRFVEDGVGVFFLTLPSATGTGDFFATPFWVGDDVSSSPLLPSSMSLDEMARFVLGIQPEALFIIRFGPPEPADWRARHPEQLFVNDRGDTVQCPSLASDLYVHDLCRFSTAVVRHCEGHGWADRIIGYWNGLRMEGTHEPVAHGWLFDHGVVMQERWRAFLRGKYGCIDNLSKAYGCGYEGFDAVPVPMDRNLTAPAPGQAHNGSYWQATSENQPLRDYLILTRDLFHAQFRAVCGAMKDAVEPSGRTPLLVYDALKQTMLGWSNFGFFDPKCPWPLYFPEIMSGSGHMDATELFDTPGFDGLVTPHDYQARGLGGIYEPEGMADSTVLRGKAFLCEMDTRTYTGSDVCYPAGDDKGFAAITWRNTATGITRGFQSYWMDVYEDWFQGEGLRRTIRRQAQVMGESVAWHHATVPGIAMVLDDGAILETNGSGSVMNEHVMWEEKMGLARCGIPYRIYQFGDLMLPGFPGHRVFYFPNLYRVDDSRLSLLREKVFRDGHVVVWGPGSGISDGVSIGPESATALTGFDFHFLPVDYPRRTLVGNFDHPITRGLREDTFIGGPLSYGPVLFPKDGTPLGHAWTKQGRTHVGLAVKDMGGWCSVFTTATPLPADLWRGLARHAGAHVYTECNDVFMADSSVVALHSLRSGWKTINLPGRFDVWDVVAGNKVADDNDRIEFNLTAPDTAVFRLVPRE